MPASPWDMPNWFNWYWWVPDDKAKLNTKEEKEIPAEEKPKLKRKRRTISKKVSTKSQKAIEHIL